MLPFHFNLRKFLGISIFLSVLLASSCASTLRYPARSIPTTYSTDERLLESMNYHLLTNVWSSHLTIELDWVEGVAPDPRAIEHLKLTLKDLVPRNKTVDIILDDEIPLQDWSELPRSNLRLLAQKYVDQLPSIEEKRHTLYILYAPRSNNNREEESYYGLFTQWWISRDEQYLPIDGVAIFLEPIREHTLLPVRNVEGEKATLAHELGHSAGLCSNWIHEAKGHPGHCRNVECVLTQPGSRAATYNFLPSLFTGNLPQKFCSDCRADLARFKQQVRELARHQPSVLDRLKQQRKAEQKIEALMQQRAYENNYKDDKQVLALIDQSVQKFPKSAKLAHRATLEALRLGEPEVALNYALQGLQADPFHAVGLKAAALLARKGEHDHALDILDENYLAAYEQVGLDAL